MESLLEFYAIVRMWGVILSIVLLAIFIFLILRGRKFVPRYFSPISAPANVVVLRKADILAAWSKVMDEFTSGTSQGRKLAIIDGDKLVDTILKTAGIAGETMMERLEIAKMEGFITLERVVRAHRLRNQVVHSHDFEPSFKEAEEAVAAYESFLRELKIL